MKKATTLRFRWLYTNDNIVTNIMFHLCLSFLLSSTHWTFNLPIVCYTCRSFFCDFTASVNLFDVYSTWICSEIPSLIHESKSSWDRPWRVQIRYELWSLFWCLGGENNFQTQTSVEASHILYYMLWNDCKHDSISVACLYSSHHSEMFWSPWISTTLGEHKTFLPFHFSYFSWGLVMKTAYFTKEWIQDSFCILYDISWLTAHVMSSVFLPVWNTIIIIIWNIDCHRTI